MFGKRIDVKFSLEAYWVIGDVHGCMFTLEALMKQLPKDTIPIFVGDLVDRGKYSKNVMEFVLENQYLVVEGNHEFLMYNYIRDAVFRNIESVWLQGPYGGLATIKSYGNDYDVIMRHIQFIEEMPKYIEIENYFITHGFGLPYYKRKENKKYIKKLYTQRMEELCDKEEPWQTYNIINVFGHTPYPDILFGQNYIGVDTGCGYNEIGSKLSALNLGTHQSISIEIDHRDLFFKD